LVEVQKHKSFYGEPVRRMKENDDDLYSEQSVSSRQSQTNYTISTTTGLRKKKEKVRSLLTRNVKEGSPLE
jgi:hypothetical protein